HGHVDQGLDQMFVIGVKSTNDASAGSEAIKKLMEAHHYTSGLGIIRQGTPTNNTEDSLSGHGFHRHNYEDLIKRMFPEKNDQISPESNAGKLAEAFGLVAELNESSAHSFYPFHDVENANLKEQRGAKDIN